MLLKEVLIIVLMGGILLAALPDRRKLVLALTAAGSLLAVLCGKFL